jgi:hypothetical protein
LFHNSQMDWWNYLLPAWRHPNHIQLPPFPPLPSKKNPAATYGNRRHGSASNHCQPLLMSSRDWCEGIPAVSAQHKCCLRMLGLLITAPVTKL